MKVINAGYKAFNGYIFSAADASAYNRACSETARIEQINSGNGDLSRQAVEHARNNQHQTFCLIAGIAL